MKILIVDGSKNVRENMVRYLELENQFEEVFEAETVKEAIKVMKRNLIDVIIFDIQLQGTSGLELVPFSRRMPRKPIMILCSNYKFPQYINIYENMSVNYFFDKSSELAELKSFIKKLVMDWKNFFPMSNYKQNSN